MHHSSGIAFYNAYNGHIPPATPPDLPSPGVPKDRGAYDIGEAQYGVEHALSGRRNHGEGEHNHATGQEEGKGLAGFLG